MPARIHVDRAHDRSAPFRRRAKAPSLSPPMAVIVALGVLLGSPIPGHTLQEPGTLTGTVVSSDDGSGLSSALIRAPDLGRYAVSDGSGRFRIAGIPPGEHRLEVERIGYRSVTLTATLEETWGEDPSLEIPMDPDPVVLSGLVVSVSGELQRRAESAASVGRVSGETIREVNPAHPAEIMNRIPGVWVSPTSTEGHMTAIRQPITTQPVYLFLEDGVPTRSPGFFNHNALYEVNVPQADRIEVIRGPGTSLYGSDAIGGVIDVGTRAASVDPEFAGTLEGNSLGFTRLLATASGSRNNDGLRLDLNLTEGDDWRDNSEYDRRSATLRWDRTLGSGRSLRTTATWSSVYQEDPSVISREDLASDPSVNYHPITYRSVEALRITSRFERRTDRSVVQVTPFFRWNTLDLMPSWMLNFDPVIYESGHASTGLMLRYHQDVSGIRGRVTTGLDLDRSPGNRTEDRIAVSRDGSFAVGWERADRIYDYEAVFRGVSPYVQINSNPWPGLHLSGGVRYDDVAFDYTSALTPLQDGPHRRPANTRVTYSNLGPSLGAAWSIVDELGVFASFRESFRSPSEGQLFRQGAAESTVSLNPVRSRSLDGGFRGNVGERLGYEISFFHMDVQDDIVSFQRPEDGLRESLNAGRTRHRGLEAGLSFHLPGDLVADATWTRASHEYVEWKPRPNQDLGGNRMEQAPRDLASARVRAPLPGLDGGHMELEWVSMGEFWMDPTNENRYDGHDLWNLRAEAPLVRGMAVQLRVLNLLDEAYAERASYNPFRGAELSPGKPQAVFVGLRYRWAR